MKTLKYLLLLSFCCLNTFVFGQSSDVVPTNIKDSDHVKIKWYTETVFTQEAVNIYRQEVGTPNWEKLNEDPIDRLDTIPGFIYNEEQIQEAYLKDSINFNIEDLGIDLNLLVGKNIIETNSFESLQSETFALLQVLLTSFEYEEYARYLGVFFEDKTARKGKSYIYQVRIIDQDQENILASSKAIKVGEYNGFDAPNNIVAKPLNEAVNFTWEPENDRYYGVQVYRGNEQKKEKVKITDRPVLLPTETTDGTNFKYSDVFFQDDSLQANTAYYYQFSAKDIFGRESRMSKEIKVVPLDEDPPLPVTNFKVEANENFEVNLSWEASPSKDVIGYQVYRMEEEEATKIGDILPKNTINYTDKTLSEQGSYSYYIASVDASDNEGISSVEIAEVLDTQAPTTPQNIKVIGLEGMVKLSWTPNTEKDLKGYKIYRTIYGKDADNFNMITPLAIQENEYVDSLPKFAKNNFYYKIVAIDTLYNVSKYSEAMEVSMPDVSPPKSPTIFKLEKLENTLQLEWFPSLDADVAAYEIFRNEGKDSTQFQKLKTEDLGKEASSFIDKSIEKGKSYQYKIRAIDDTGNASEFSNVYTTSIPKDKLSGEATKKISLNYQKKKQEVTIKWKTIQSENLRGSMVYRKTSKGRYIPVSPMLKKELEYKDAAIQKGQNYTYQVRSFYKNGNILNSDEAVIISE